MNLALPRTTVCLVFSLLLLSAPTGLGAPDQTLEEAKANYAETKKRLDDILERYQKLHAEKVAEAKEALSQEYAGDLTLKRGTRQITFHTSNYGSGRMPTASIRIIHKGTKEELPLVNTGSEIQRFLKQRVNGEPVISVSDWEPVEVVPE